MSYVIRFLARALGPVIRHVLRDLLQSGSLVPKVQRAGPCGGGCDGCRCAGGPEQPAAGVPVVAAGIADTPTEDSPEAAGAPQGSGVIAVPVAEVIERVGLIAAVLQANKVPTDVTTILALRKVHNDIVAEVTRQQVKSKEPSIIQPDNGKVH